jgi:hypothetical protein
MMVSEAMVEVIPPEEDFPPMETLAAKLVELDNGCILWIGSIHARTGPFIKWHGRQIQVHRALYFYEYGILPKKYLVKQCEPSACVAPSHRTVSACA